MPASADTITFNGSNIPLRSCTIEAVQGGNVIYLDNRGQRQRRELDDVQALGFEKLAQLDEAQQAIAQRDYAAALAKLLPAALKAETDLQRLWIHSRLALVHDLRKEYVPAAGHAAATMAISDDPYWRRVEPISEVVEPSYALHAQVKESLENLQLAARKVKSTELKDSLSRMLKNVQPIYERSAKAYTGQPIASGSTLSGFSKQDILAGKLEIKPSPLPAASATTQQDQPQEQETPAASAPDVLARPETVYDPDSPGAIDRLLAESNPAGALELCRRIAEGPGDRDMGHFLYQYGTSLVRSGHRPDAAVMFARCAVLFPDSPDAPLALIQTALIYRDEYRKADVAKRLLQRAADLATEIEQPAAAMLAKELLGSF